MSRRPEILPATDPNAPSPPAPDGNHSKVLRFADFDWGGVDDEPYKKSSELWEGITRKELVGKRGESTNFHVRYFEIDPGGFSTLEEHQHEHVVIPLRGTGEVQMEELIFRVGFGDVVYVAPGDSHQFRNPADATEPFGFLCLVDAKRDRPEPSAGSNVCTICE